MEPDYDGLRSFLIDENQFSADRVEKSIERLKACKKAKTQLRLDSFFKTSVPSVKAGEKFDPFKKKDNKRASAAAGSTGAKKIKK
jgi:flap endonuclease-1